MPRPALHGLLRFRPPKSYLKYIKFKWKPFPRNSQVLWGFAAFRFLRHKANLRPDAYVRLSDLAETPLVPRKQSRKIFGWARSDHLHRFQLTTELDRVEGQKGWHTTWYIRAKRGHTIPSVAISTTRIIHYKQISSLTYAITPEHWPLIEKQNGILPSTPNLHTPQKRNSRFTYFAQDLATLIPQFLTSYPAENNTPDGQHLVQLHIGINVKQAMDLGIKFFRNKYNQILSTGLLTGVDDKDLGKIPMEVFNNVFVVALKREIVFQQPEEEKRNNEKKGKQKKGEGKERRKSDPRQSSRSPI